MILLDTCALLWLAHDRKRISRSTLRRINEAPVASISAITSFEIGIKYRAGKLNLPVPPPQWMAGILQHHGISTVDITVDICLRASELPPIHGDPCDRFIIATALLQNAPVVTADKRFESYGVEVLA
jgi:PIN domain nuclease of toxin-antitoxin system